MRCIATPSRQVCAIVALVGITLCSACSTDIQSGIESANDLLYEKQYVAAERLYYKLLKRLGEEGELHGKADQQRVLILDRLGKINALYLHDYGKAVHFLQKLVQLYPRTEYAFAARAMVADVYHHKLGNLEAAVSEYQKLVAEFPDKSEARWAQLQIASAFFQLRNYEQARTEAALLAQRWPSSSEAAQARFQIANSYYVQGRYAEAIATYEGLLEGTPDPSLASLVLFELGNCFQELGDFDRALAYYYACLADHPNPLLVQRKIRRVRTRMHHVRPSDEIQLPAYVLKRLEVAQGAGAGGESSAAEGAPRSNVRRKPGGERAPEAGIYKGSRFDEEEGDIVSTEPTVPTRVKHGSSAKTTRSPPNAELDHNPESEPKPSGPAENAASPETSPEAPSDSPVVSP